MWLRGSTATPRGSVRACSYGMCEVCACVKREHTERATPLTARVKCRDDCTSIRQVPSKLVPHGDDGDLVYQARQLNQASITASMHVQKVEEELHHEIAVAFNLSNGVMQ